MSLHGAARPIAFWHKTHFLSVLDLTPDEIESCLELAASMKAAATGRTSARATARRPARRAAVREAVAAYAVDVRDRDSRARRRRDRAAGRRRARRSRDARGRRAQPRALGLRRRRPHVRAGAASSAGRRRAEAAGRQRAHRRGASVPGAGRRAHAAGALGIAARPDGRLRRRRQQRRDLARAGGGHAGRKRRRRVSARVTSCPPACAMPSRVSRALVRRLRLTNDPTDAVSRADAVYTDVWASMGQESEAAARRAIFLPYQVNDASDGGGTRRRALHALPAGASRRRGDRRGHRVGRRRSPSIRPRTVSTRRRRCSRCWRREAAGRPPAFAPRPPMICATLQRHAAGGHPALRPA